MGKRKYEGSKDDATKRSKNESEAQLDTPEVEPHEDTTPGQKPKKIGGFEVKHFRKELAAKQGQTMILTQFLQVCLNPDNDVDYLLDYLKIGGNSHEILRQISADDKKNLTLATPAFHLFHLVIVKVQSSLPHMIAVTEEACRYFLNNFMSTVEIMISENSGPRHRKIILKLLTSMVTLNSDLGIEVLNQAPLTPKHLQYITEKPNYKEKDNVRTAFVHFMTSFFIEGHLPLIKALLDKQGLLALVIPGLLHDEAEAVLIFLNILKKNVVDNPLISKSLKLKTFSHNVLHNMFKIFSWKGPPETSREVQTEFRPEITSLLAEIILTVFTSHKLGVYFTDNSLGTTDVHKNQNLYKALLSLKRPWENENEGEVILQIMDKCPDLHRAIISVIEQSFEPQHSPIWERTVQFTIKLLDILKPENFISRLSKLSVGQVSNFVRFITLPLPLLKFINRDLGKDHSVSVYCIKLLVKMLQTLRRYMQILGAQDSQTQIVDLKSKLEYFFPKHMPAPNTTVALINNVMQNKEDTETVQGYKLPKLDKTESLTYLVDLLLLYNDIQPSFFETLEDSIDMKKILDFSMTLTSGNTSLLKFKVVSLWLTIDSSGISLKNPMFKELFLIMLEVYTNDEDDTWIEAKDTLFNFFQNTAIFEIDEDEIHLVLYLLRNCKVNPTSLIADIIEYVLINIDQLTNEMRTSVADYENAYKGNVGTLDKLLDDLTEGRNTDENVFLENKMPSPFVLGCVQYAQVNKTAKKNLKPFLSLYITNLLHSNFSPEFSEVLIGETKLDARSYITNWTSNPVPLPNSIIEESNTLNAISRSIINGEDISLKDILTFIDEVSEEESDLSINGEYYKIQSNKNIDSSDLLMWAKYLIFCTVRLSDMGLLEDERQRKITMYLKALINVGKKRHMMDTCRCIILSLFKSPHVLKIYKPLDLKDGERALLPTQFILEIIHEQRDMVNYLDVKYRILKSYQQKNYSEILKTLNKMNKRKNMNSEHTVKVLDAIGLTKDDDLLIFGKIFNCEVNSCVKDDKDPSIALDVLQALLDKYSKSINTDLPQHVLRKSMKLYTELLTNKDVVANLTNLEQTFVKYLENKPHEVAYIPEDIFKKFFYANSMRKSTSSLASILLKFNMKYCKVFKEEISRPEILSQRELTLPLGNATLNHTQFLMNNKDFLPAIYNEYKTNINKLLEKPHKAGQVYINSWKFIRKLILECMEMQDCQKVFGKSQKYEVMETCHVQLLQAVFMKICLSDEGFKKEYFTNYLLSILHVITIALKESKDDEILAPVISSVNDVIKGAKSIKGFNTEQKNDYQKFTESAVWQNFCKSVLKDSLKVKKADQSSTTGSQLLFLMSTLVKLLYPPNHEDIVLLFDMVTSHSEFLNVMLSYHSSEIKTSLIEFLYTLTQTNKSVMKLQHVPVYLSSYHATRSPSDRLILALLHFYETNGQPVNEYKPYVFGDSAANYYAVRKNRSSTLWSHPTANRVLSLFERDIIERTVRNFPVNQKLEYHYELPHNTLTLKDSLMKISKEGSLKVKDNEGAVKSKMASQYYEHTVSSMTEDVPNCSHFDVGSEIYDASFVFPLLSHVLAPGSTASCFKLLRSGLLSLPVAALSSLCPRMRAAAYHVLHRFCLLLDTETRHKNDKLFLTDFVATLRQSLSSLTGPDSNHRLPAIDALYLARALMVSTYPTDPLYKPVNNFFIAKQLVDMTVVPDFLSLFHDSDVESTDRRLWILDIIKDGTKTMTDVNVIFKTMCLKMIMDFYSSVLSDRKTKEKILGVISSLISIPRAFDILIEGYGLISWLKSVVNSINKDDRILVKRIIELIKNMLHSMTINAFTKNLSVKNGKVLELKINKDVEYELMSILYHLHQHTNRLEAEDVKSYIHVVLMLSKRTVKLLNKEQMLILVSRTAASLDSESVKLLSKALVDNDSTVLCSKNKANVGSEEREYLLEEVTSLVRCYLA